MNKSCSRFFVITVALLAGVTSSLLAAPYGPDGRSTRWTQPNGEKLALRVFGDDYYAHTETTAGYTVVMPEGTMAYFYAKLSKNGSELIPTNTLANLPPPQALEKHLNLTSEAIREISAANRVKYDGDRQETWNRRVKALRSIENANHERNLRGPEAAAAKAEAAPVLGPKTGLTILVQFPDDTSTAAKDPVDFPTNREKIVRFCNEDGYSDDGNSGSVRDYFFDQSVGLMTYTQNVTQVVTMPKARDYYNYSNYPTNTKFRPDASRELIKDAIEVLQTAAFDFAGLTTDVKGHAVATNVFFAGPDSGRFANGLWPQSWALATPISVGTLEAPMTISKFQITNIDSNNPVIGTFCHENGHLLLGYPDIYSLYGEGVGTHCLMGSGNLLDRGKTPAPINAYFKELAGWSTVTEIEVNDYLTVTLPTTGNVSYKIRNQKEPTEFFVVENRGSGDKWAADTLDKGIIIWHVDENVDGNFRIPRNGHYGVAIEQADGRYDLENSGPGRYNRGDDGDYFDLKNPMFSDQTKPDAEWWDGTKSRIKIDVASRIGPNTEVRFGGVPPDTIIVGSPNGGETLFHQSVYPIQWEANIDGHVKIDLFRDGVLVENIAEDTADDGQFQWSVSGKLSAGDGYAIIISSLTNPVVSMDQSDAVFTISDFTFPLGKSLGSGWFEPSFASRSWSIVEDEVFEGKSSLRSQKISDGKTAAIAHRGVFRKGVISFYVKVSSEQKFDVMRFLIDGVPQSIGSEGAVGSLSGDDEWRFVSIPVEAGTRTFMWTYEKDDSYASLMDAAWIDGLALPPTTQEIVVHQPKGENLLSGKALREFPNTVVRTSSEPKRFTVANLGRAPLTGLRVSLSGMDAKDFSFVQIKHATLNPNEETAFSIVFSPKLLGERKAVLHIQSNDSNESDFTVDLLGTCINGPEFGETGVVADSKVSHESDGAIFLGFRSGELLATPAIGITSVEVFDGKKYLALTAKKSSLTPGRNQVEVSSNLLDWYSGKNFTTTLIDDDLTLKVRDNTPISKDFKRFIRLR